ncbi:MAG: UDP-3-O-(3-hydroxymyristoyl)glucosamine N-acyltransferase [bacterium]|nr:UDP-3-O-(3-hydroxymyristoyl)glucosamine N-acyltransferase [bacterium]MDD5354100.1 UDP-3-O-(3-hydroxymyristoyl)glucosamine N-acyltransferase [bacterium]MDD5756366.1 UDP-3-O-(3-hydroxymyristoyl)glucosamine N-acyltransferase [bacterium]
MIEKTLAELATLVGGKILGDPQLLIRGVAGIREAKSDEITFLSNPRYAKELAQTGAGAIIVSPESPVHDKAAIICDNPYLAFARILAVFNPAEIVIPIGIHASAIISPQAKLGNNVAIGPFVMVEDGAIIGDETVIYPGTYIGKGSKIGNDCLLYANISIREKIKIGNKVIIHSGAVIGSDGFGFVPHAGENIKIPQVGSVIIEDNVEIGANVCIARGTLGDTMIGSGTKIDNLVQISHNVKIRRNCIIVAQVGISGSTTVEDNVTIAGQAGVIGHITIGKGSIVAAQAGVTKDVPSKEIVSGYPAQPHQLAKRINAEMNRLPQLNQRVKELEKRIAELEKNNKPATGD